MKMSLLQAYGITFASLVMNGIYTIEMVPKPYREATEQEIAKYKATGAF